MKVGLLSVLVLLWSFFVLGTAAPATGAGSSWASSWTSTGNHGSNRPSSDAVAATRLQLRSLLYSTDPALHKQARALLQQGKTQVPQCVWSDVREVCAPSQLMYLSLKAKPVTVFHRVAAQAYDRNLVCNGHPSEVECNKDRANRCMFWSKSCVGMDAYELVNWVGGERLTGDSTAAGFTCKGTDAAIYRECKTASDAGPKGLCLQLPLCQYINLADECLPARFGDKTIKQLQATTDAFNAFDATIWGSCNGSCYVRQAAVCDKAYNSSTACSTKPFCVWDTDPYDGNQVCIHKDTAAKAGDDYSKEYAKMRETCFKAKHQVDCERPKILPVNVGAFRSLPELDKLAATPLQSCPL